jgi:hypothetical protein
MEIFQFLWGIYFMVPLISIEFFFCRVDDLNIISDYCLPCFVCTSCASKQTLGVFKVEEAPTTALYTGLYVFQAEMPACGRVSWNETQGLSLWDWSPSQSTPRVGVLKLPVRPLLLCPWEEQSTGGKWGWGWCNYQLMWKVVWADRCRWGRSVCLLIQPSCLASHLTLVLDVKWTM